MNKFIELLLQKVPSAVTHLIQIGVVAGAFLFGKYYQDSVMSRDFSQQERAFHEELYQYQKENLALQDSCNRLKQEIRELNFYINQSNAKNK